MKGDFMQKLELDGIDVIFRKGVKQPERWFPTDDNKQPFVVVSPRIRASRLKALVLSVLQEHRELSEFRAQYRSA